MIKTVCAAAALAFLAAASAGCSSEQPAAEAPAQGGIPGLTAENARLVLPAVKGSPAGLYFDLVNASERGIAIRTAAVDAAKTTQIHGTMMYSGKMTMNETGPQSVAAGQTLKFEPGGLHIMAFDLRPDVAAGGTVKVTLTAAGGDTMSFDAAVQGAGDAR